MNRQTLKKEKDPAEEALALLEKENREFKDHWVWKELQCSPEEFFGALKKHVQTMNIPKEKWDAAYQKAKESHRIRALEKRNQFKPVNLRMIGTLRA